MNYSFSVLLPTSLLLLVPSKCLSSLMDLMNKSDFSHKEVLSLKVSFVVVVLLQ